MPPELNVPPGLPPPGLPPTPRSLLWAYQLTRENKTLTNYLKEVKQQLDDTEAFARNIQKCLNELIENVTSLAHILTHKAQTDDDKHQLLLLRRQLQHTVGPLRDYGKTLVRKNKQLVECIAAVEDLDGIQALSMAIDIPGSTPATAYPGITTIENTYLSPNAANPLATTISQNQLLPIQQAETPLDPALSAALAAIMKQNNRSLDEYYDAANAFRREQRALATANEHALVTAFIAGCDDKLYRRRLTHSLRKMGWAWAWLTHEVQFLVLEEEYMEKQRFALAHRKGDGSVLWPDGSTRMRFVPLPPITEEDLTASEGES